MTALVRRPPSCSATSSIRGTIPARRRGCGRCATSSRRPTRATRASRPSGFTQGDELQGLLAPGADPFTAVLRAALHPDARELRWAFVAGDVEPGPGPPPSGPGRRFFVARESIGRARAHRDGLVAVTGDPEADARLADLGPLLAALLADRRRASARSRA